VQCNSSVLLRDNYFTAIRRNQLKKFNGLPLNLKYGKTVQLADQDVKSISGFKDYPSEKGIVSAQ
jgi:hypothetical protein